MGGGRREDRGRRKDGCVVEGGVAVLSVWRRKTVVTGVGGVERGRMLRDDGMHVGKVYYVHVHIIYFYNCFSKEAE